MYHEMRATRGGDWGACSPVGGSGGKAPLVRVVQGAINHHDRLGFARDVANVEKTWH